MASRQRAASDDVLNDGTAIRPRLGDADLAGNYCTHIDTIWIGIVGPGLALTDLIRIEIGYHRYVWARWSCRVVTQNVDEHLRVAALPVTRDGERVIGYACIINGQRVACMGGRSESELTDQHRHTD